MNPGRRTGRKVVFLGPSLGHSEARRLCPDATFLPPIRFGDLYALACEPPGQVLIIDGVFYDSTPVWQREILQLLQSGWQVLGASSMGALRALELEPYGMIGLGTVFEWYRSGRIEGDDEVALLHSVADMDYQPLTLPLVDVRHMLIGLEAQGVLAPSQVSDILFQFKRMGYEMRTRSALLALVRAHHGDVAAVRERLTDKGSSLKTHDARLALRFLAGQLPLPATRKRWPDPPPPPVQAEAVLQRRIYPLVGPSARVVDALGTMAQQPDTLARPVRESRRRWFLCDWARITRMGPSADERHAIAVQHAAELARALDTSLPRWCAASAVREDEMPEWMAGIAIETWLARRTASEIGLDHLSHEGEESRIPLVLVDWMRRHGVEAPPECRASIDHTASWLVWMGPAYFGAPDFHADVALVMNLAANGDLARWRRLVQARTDSEAAP